MQGSWFSQSRGGDRPLSPALSYRAVNRELAYPDDRDTNDSVKTPASTRKRQSYAASSKLRIQHVIIGLPAGLIVMYLLMRMGAMPGERPGAPLEHTSEKALGAVGEGTEEITTSGGQPEEEDTFQSTQSEACRSKAKVEFPAEVQAWVQGRFKLQKTLGLMQYSAYRMNGNKFAILGMQDVFILEDFNTRKPPSKGTCAWHEGDNRVLEGELKFFYGGETHDKQYEVVVLHCTLSEDTAPCGGYLVGTINGVELALFREDTNQDHALDPDPPFKSGITYCSPPVSSELNPRAVRNWMDYHRVFFGVEHFVLYDAGAVTNEFREEVGPYLRAGELEVVEFREAVLQRGERAWAFAQGLAINDCLYRSRFSANWIWAANLDDFLEMPPGVTFASLIHKYTGSPWMTIGAIIRATEHCRPRVVTNGQASRTADGVNEGGSGMQTRKEVSVTFTSFVERMVFRATEPYCSDRELYPDPNVCLLHYGHRTYFANPRLTTLLQIHMAVIPFYGGVDLNTETEIRKSCFPGLALKRQQKFHCTVEMGAGDEVPAHLVHDTGIANKMPVAWACPVDHATGKKNNGCGKDVLEGGGGKTLEIPIDAGRKFFGEDSHRGTVGTHP